MSPAEAVVTPEDHRDAADIATAAGRVLLDLRRELDSPGVDLAALRGEGDRRSNEFILAALADRHPDDAVLSEESVDDARRVGHRRVWVIDPLDGTREFAESGRVDWAVHVALVVDGTPVAGAVALPAQDLTLVTEPASVPAGSRPRAPRLAVSRTRPPALIAPLAERLGATLVPMGSAGAKAMAVLLGEADAYVHGGGQYEWDSAAPVAVAAAAGLHTSRLDGSPLRYNNEDPWLPDLVVCLPDLAPAVLEALREIGDTQPDPASPSVAGVAARGR